MVVGAEKKFLNRDRGLASEAWDVHNKMDGWMDGSTWLRSRVRVHVL